MNELRDFYSAEWFLFYGISKFNGLANIIGLWMMLNLNVYLLCIECALLIFTPFNDMS